MKLFQKTAVIWSKSNSDSEIRFLQFTIQQDVCLRYSSFVIINQLQEDRATLASIDKQQIKAINQDKLKHAWFSECIFACDVTL